MLKKMIIYISKWIIITKMSSSFQWPRAARHGLKLGGKLRRIEEADRQFSQKFGLWFFTYFWLHVCICIKISAFHFRWCVYPFIYVSLLYCIPHCSFAVVKAKRIQPTTVDPSPPRHTRGVHPRETMMTTPIPSDAIPLLTSTRTRKHTISSARSRSSPQ